MTAATAPLNPAMTAAMPTHQPHAAPVVKCMTVAKSAPMTVQAASRNFFAADSSPKLRIGRRRKRRALRTWRSANLI